MWPGWPSLHFTVDQKKLPLRTHRTSATRPPRRVSPEHFLSDFRRNAADAGA